MKPSRPLFVVALSLCVCAQSLAAQVGFESLIRDISDVNFFFSCWYPRGALQTKTQCPTTRNGYGVEVSYDLGVIGLPGTRADTIPGTWQLVSKETSYTRAGVDSTRTWTWRPRRIEPRDYILLEFALGYSQFSGFESVDTSFDLRGVVRELPAVSIYGTLTLGDRGFFLNHISPYVGVRSGVIQLSNVQILDPIARDTVLAYAGTGVAFQIGGTLGLVVSCCADRAHFFLERAYNVRRFPNVQWAAAGTAKVVASYPRSLDFTGRAISLGVQFTLKPSG